MNVKRYIAGVYFLLFVVVFVEKKKFIPKQNICQFSKKMMLRASAGNQIRARQTEQPNETRRLFLSFLFPRNI